MRGVCVRIGGARVQHRRLCDLGHIAEVGRLDPYNPAVVLRACVCVRCVCVCVCMHLVLDNELQARLYVHGFKRRKPKARTS